ncbi:hypothetical protein AB0F52_44035 [Amycolatopsis sp. NPDC024027]|uniref:hypothetical protein n=1 Tax=Amycolatopsis sp. NPDC024027 TaxID=3154327 RepID=UPI0033F8DD0C
MSFPSDRPATWFVTGTSRGLGPELVTQLLRRGDQVGGVWKVLRATLPLLRSQPGDPVKGAEAIIRQVVSGEGPTSPMLENSPTRQRKEQSCARS